MIKIEKCCCGHKSCQDYWLVGIGKFVQSSGFTFKEARQIAQLLNDQDRRLVLEGEIRTSLDVWTGDHWRRIRQTTKTSLADAALMLLKRLLRDGYGMDSKLPDIVLALQLYVREERRSAETQTTDQAALD